MNNRSEPSGGIRRGITAARSPSSKNNASAGIPARRTSGSASATKPPNTSARARTTAAAPA
ncbi:hypothetical protein Ahu01nite_063990 [Winogradskya humida]|uniref:Uncharacterized protein n=1 Tax=Winogradskya humida TaxID=113566 RepID=A0ABQ3ZXG5_9ACTN|nr:hypothetical protein Ahu01nite_063990 [Actinoplanes humidus]